MTGSPLLRLVFVLVGLLLLALPAWRLANRTQPSRAASIPASPPKNPASQPIALTFSAAPAPEEIQVEISGSNVVTLRPLQWPATVTLPLALPAEGIDLVISATWAQTTEAPVHALRIQATRDAQPLADTTFWGGASVADVMTLTAPAQP